MITMDFAVNCLLHVGSTAALAACDEVCQNIFTPISGLAAASILWWTFRILHCDVS